MARWSGAPGLDPWYPQNEESHRRRAGSGAPCTPGAPALSRIKQEWVARGARGSGEAGSGERTEARRDAASSHSRLARRGTGGGTGLVLVPGCEPAWAGMRRTRRRGPAGAAGEGMAGPKRLRLPGASSGPQHRGQGSVHRGVAGWRRWQGFLLSVATRKLATLASGRAVLLLPGVLLVLVLIRLLPSSGHRIHIPSRAQAPEGTPGKAFPEPRGRTG